MTEMFSLNLQRGNFDHAAVTKSIGDLYNKLSDYTNPSAESIASKYNGMNQFKYAFIMASYLKIQVDSELFDCYFAKEKDIQKEKNITIQSRTLELFINDLKSIKINAQDFKSIE